MATRFVPDHDGMLAISRTVEMAKALDTFADYTASNARNLAPVDEGDYRNSIDTTSGVDGGVATARVNANDWKAGLIEFGTEDTPTFAPLRRGAEQAGLKLVDRGE